MGYCGQQPLFLLKKIENGEILGEFSIFAACLLIFSENFRFL